MERYLGQTAVALHFLRQGCTGCDTLFIHIVNLMGWDILNHVGPCISYFSIFVTLNALQWITVKLLLMFSRWNITVWTVTEELCFAYPLLCSKSSTLFRVQSRSHSCAIRFFSVQASQSFRKGAAGIWFDKHFYFSIASSVLNPTLFKTRTGDLLCGALMYCLRVYCANFLDIKAVEYSAMEREFRTEGD